ncbi:restriction endonuclease subunit S, partial [Mitsuokella sp.]|uniref:restriction endonuclease subunit S n=1 Tax=Mitsuokella sp. TaxID=2049034 RepID=UPI002A7FBBEA
MTSQNRTLEQRWQRFRIGDIFEKCSMNRIKKPVSQLSKHRTVNNDTPVLTASTKNRGFACYASRVDTNSTSRNVISIVEKGTGKAYYHSADFAIASGVYVIQPKCKAIQCDEVGLFFETCINKAIKYACFSWFIPARFPDVSDLYITLPVNKNGEIYYEYMISLMHDVIVQRSVDIEHKFNDIINMYLKETVLKNFELTEEDKEVLIKFIGNDGVTKQDVLKLISGFTPEKKPELIKYKIFKVKDFFEIQKTKSYDSYYLNNGNQYDYVTRSVSNRGVISHTNKIDAEGINPSGTFSLELMNCTFFYRENEWYAGQFVRVVKPKNKKICECWQFWETLLNSISSNLKSVLVRDIDETFLNSEILLPVTPSGEPDYDLMTKFITAIEKIVIKDMAKKIEQEQQCLRQIT